MREKEEIKFSIMPTGSLFHFKRYSFRQECSILPYFPCFISIFNIVLKAKVVAIHVLSVVISEYVMPKVNKLENQNTFKNIGKPHGIHNDNSLIVIVSLKLQ